MLSDKRLFLVVVLLGSLAGSVFGFGLWKISRSVLAIDRYITTSADFDDGKYVDTESRSKLGQLKMEAGGSWGPRVNSVPNVGLADQAAVVSDGDYVYIIASSDNYFARYLPKEDRWERLADSLHYAYPGSDLVVKGDYIYAVFGGYQKEFARYSIIENTWTEMAMLPDITYGGTSLATNGTEIFCLRGYNTTDFWKYHIETNTWSSVNNPPATIYTGANLVYSASTNKMYTPRGNNTNTFYVFDLGTSIWSTGATLPAAINEDHNIDIGGTLIYVTRGSGTTAFWSFNVGTTRWTSLVGAPQPIYQVGSVYNQSEDMVYVFRGNGSQDFWKYNPTTNQFAGPTDLPAAPSTGSDINYLNGYLYYNRGGTANMYRYNMGVGISWQQMANGQVALSDDTKGVVAGNQIYYLRGAGTTAFYSFDPSVGVGGTWTSLQGPPTGVAPNYGAGLAYPGAGNYIYATRGALTRTFMRYTIGVGQTWDDAVVADLPDDAEAGYGSRIIGVGTTELYYFGGTGIAKFLKYNITSNTWTVLGNLPFSPYYGTDVTYYNGKLYFLAGYYKPDFWEYTIATSSWRMLAPTQDYGATEIGPWAGASIESLGNGTFYVILGNSVTRLLTYTVDANDYPISGGWTSKALDLSYVASWSSLQVQSSLPGDSSISWTSRSSNDQITWSDWIAGVGSSIGSPIGRYLQVGVTMVSTSDRSQTPKLFDVQVNYVGDTGVPTNPTTVAGVSQQVSGVGLTSSESYGYQAPYFSWSGATDSQTSIAGYYVYFGTGSSASPVTEGNYQTASNYIVTTPMDQTTYYLRLVTVDSAGNNSAATTAFVYTYNGIAPPITLTKTTTADFEVGTTSAVNVSGDKIKLQGKTGFWEQERISSLPAGIYLGGDMAYKSSTNKIYLFRGYNSNTFYIYDLTTNTVSVGPTAPGAVYYGGGMVEGPGNYLYAMKGLVTSSFWRFDVGTTTWSDVAAADLPQTISYGGSLEYDGSRFIYATRGSGDDALMRYDTVGDIWEMMANADFNAPINQPNNTINDGSDMAYDGNDTLYVMQGGGRDGFAGYSISANTWLTLTDLPMFSGAGSQIEYDSTTNAIYYVAGSGRNFVYKYDIASQLWSDLAETPMAVGGGASLKKIGEFMYLTVGQGSSAVYKYSISKNMWLIPTVGLFGGWFRGSDSRTFGYGSDIIKGDGDNMYLTRGNFDNLFVRYNSVTGVATRMADVPAGLYLGSELVYDSVHNRIYATASYYYRKLFVYDVATDTWSEEVNDPPPLDVGEGSSMIFNATDRYIYWLRGANTQSFYRFNTEGVGTSKWSALPNTGLTMSYGSDMVLKSDYIYTLRGANTTGFLRYGPLSVGATWSNVAVADLPTGANIYNDGFLVDLGGDYLMACRGANQNTCYRYSITGDSWTVVSSATSPYIYTGGAGAVSSSGEKMLVIAGNGQLNTMSNGLYSYVIESSSSSYEESGDFVSPVHDLTAVYKFANLSIDVTLPDNTGLTVYTKSSTDNSTWGEWTVASEQKIVGTSRSYKINSSTARYFQVKLALTSSDGVRSGTINSYSVNYYQDTTEPINPTALAGYTNSGAGTTFVSGVWNNSTAPYISWSGASDGDNGSGVEGYYVYFGTGATANPVTLGAYTTGTSLIGTTMTSGETYYFRLKTKDNADNVTTDVGTTLVYKFDNTAPENPTAVLADPPGYTTTDNFTFTWGAGSDSSSGIAAYCYKTGASSGPLATEQCITDVGVTGITGITKYQTDENIFYLRVKDAAGNFASSSLTAIFKFSGTAPSRPTNLRMTYPDVGTSNTVNDFAFAWDQPESFLGAATNLVYKYSINEEPTPSNVSTVGTNVV